MLDTVKMGGYVIIVIPKQRRVYHFIPQYQTSVLLDSVKTSLRV